MRIVFYRIPWLWRLSLEQSRLYNTFYNNGTQALGKRPLLEAARRFANSAQIEDWSIRRLIIQRYGSMAICNYFFTETGTTDGKRFHLSGIATDVLINRGRKWKYVSHHATLDRTARLPSSSQ